MTLNRKDALATVLTGLAVLAFAATDQGWNVWLIGSSHRWAAGAIFLLGSVTCTLGSAGKEFDATTKLLAVIGTLALAFGIWAVWTASLTPLALLVACNVALWAGSTLRHAWHPGHRTLPV